MTAKMSLLGVLGEDSVRVPLLERESGSSDPGDHRADPRDIEIDLADAMVHVMPEMHNEGHQGTTASSVACSLGTQDSPTAPQASSGVPTTDRAVSAALRASIATQEALGGLALFSTNEEDEDDDDDTGPGGESCWRSPSVLTKLALNLLSALTLAGGIICRLTQDQDPARRSIFRWMLFCGTWAPVWSLVSWTMEWAFELVELYYFQDTLAYLDSLQHATSAVVFMLAEILLFRVLFILLFCGPDGADAEFCASDSYQQMVSISTKTMSCMALFCFASWLSSILAKAVSTHFYKTTHFRKIQDALEKEYFLQALSAPKRQVVKKRMERLKGKGRAEKQEHSQFHRRTPSLSRMTSSGSIADLSSRQSSISSPRASLPGVLDGRSMQRRAEALGLEVEPPVARMQEGEVHHQAPPSMTVGRMRPFVLREPSSGSFPAEPVSAPASAALGPLAEGKEESGLVPGAAESMEITPEMLQVTNHVDESQTEVTLAEMTDESQLERLRTAVVVKTYSKLINRYKVSTAESEHRMVRQVKAFSKALFKNVVGRTSNLRDYATQEDFNLFFPDGPEGRAQAATAFGMFDATALPGKVTRTEMRNTVMDIFRERANIAGSLVDTDSIVQSLEQGFAGFLHFLFIGPYLLIWNINLIAGFTTFSATLVGLSFVFGNSIRTMFESILFLFSEHPYDVGDSVHIDGNLYQVKKVRLLFTQMTNVAGHPAYFSNADLHTKQIDNWSRSTTQTDFSYIEVDVGIASEFKQELLKRLTDHIRSHPLLYTGKPKVFIAGMMQAGLKALLQIQFTLNCAADEFDKRDLGRDGIYQIISDMMGAHRGTGVQYTAGAVQMYGVGPGQADLSAHHAEPGHSAGLGSWRSVPAESLHHEPLAAAAAVLHDC